MEASMLNKTGIKAGAGEGGGAGGGSGGAGGGSGVAGEGEAKQLDEATQGFIKAFVGEQVSMAITSHLKRSSFKEMLGGIVNSALEPITAELKARAKPKEDDGEHPGSGDDLSPKARALLAQTQSELAAMKKQLDTTREAAEAETRERTLLRDALRSNGVPDQVSDALAVMLHVEQKRVKTMDDGTVVFTVARDYGPEDWPVEKGVPEYLKTEQGKAFLPPAQGSGSGGGRGGRPQVPNGQPDKAALGRALLGVKL
jgi:hypothetical protein